MFSSIEYNSFHSDGTEGVEDYSQNEMLIFELPTVMATRGSSNHSSQSSHSQQGPLSSRNKSSTKKTYFPWSRKDEEHLLTLAIAFKFHEYTKGETKKSEMGKGRQVPSLRFDD